eukprot:8998471-Heterocapsa_arctica.AAC.1
MCLALGSGEEEEGSGPTYFGSEAVLHDLQREPGYSTGLVELSEEGPERCQITGRTTHLRFKEWFVIGPNTHQVTPIELPTHTLTTTGTNNQPTPNEDEGLDHEEEGEDGQRRDEPGNIHTEMDIRLGLGFYEPGDLFLPTHFAEDKLQSEQGTEEQKHKCTGGYATSSTPFLHTTPPQKTNAPHSTTHHPAHFNKRTSTRPTTNASPT